MASYRDTEAWLDLKASIAGDMLPQSLVARIPDDEWRVFASDYAHLVLCDTLEFCGTCAGCRSWLGDEHPDMLIAGSGDRAARMKNESGVREIDEFQMALSLRAVVSRRRLGVLPFASKMSIEAKNAMLKIAEEPPDGTYILFTTSEDIGLPTIASRSRMFAPAIERQTVSAPPPKDAAEWAEWLAKGKKKNITLADITGDIEAWACFLSERGDWRAAGDISDLASMSERRRMSIAMVQDAAHAVLKEGVRVEQLFGDLRET